MLIIDTIFFLTIFFHTDRRTHRQTRLRGVPINFIHFRFRFHFNFSFWYRFSFHFLSFPLYTPYFPSSISYRYFYFFSRPSSLRIVFFIRLIFPTNYNRFFPSSPLSFLYPVSPFFMFPPLSPPPPPQLFFASQLYHSLQLLLPSWIKITI